MPASLLRSPSQWTVAIHGNISITIVLFLVRYVSPKPSWSRTLIRTCSSLWFAGVGRDKPAAEKVDESVSLDKSSTQTYSLAGMSPGWYYIFAVVEPVSQALPRSSHFSHRERCSIDPQLVMTAGALYILLLPSEYGKLVLPDRYERVTSTFGTTVRGQMVLGGLGSCASLLTVFIATGIALT
jgi:hypothetical protein